MSDVKEVVEYHEAYAQTWAGFIEQLELDAVRLSAPHLTAQADQLRAHVDNARDTSLRMLGVIP